MNTSTIAKLGCQASVLPINARLPGRFSTGRGCHARGNKSTLQCKQSFFGSRIRSQLPIGVGRKARGVVSVTAETSYVMVKPDGVQRGLVGNIISRFENKGFKLKGLKLFQAPKDLAEEHYHELKERPFYPALVEYITSGPVVCMIWEGDGVVASARKIIGVTDPLEADPGTIRGDLAVHKGRNVVHGSDSPENGAREAGLWFDSDEVVEWSSTLEPWLVE